MDDLPVEILLVEDNQYDIALALYAFEESKLANRIHVVRDGVEALEFLFATGRHASRSRPSNPKLVLLDLKLPLLDGLEVLRRLKADPRTQPIPVVVMTSSREDKDLTRAYELGANSYVVKPVDFQQFADVSKQLGYYWLMINQQPTLPAGSDENVRTD